MQFARRGVSAYCSVIRLCQDADVYLIVRTNGDFCMVSMTGKAQMNAA